MTFTYKPLWKILIDRSMNKEALRKTLGFSHSTIAKMGKGEHVSFEVLGKICAYLNVQPGDVIEYLPDRQHSKE